MSPDPAERLYADTSDPISLGFENSGLLHHPELQDLQDPSVLEFTKDSFLEIVRLIERDYPIVNPNDISIWFEDNIPIFDTERYFDFFTIPLTQDPLICFARALRMFYIQHLYGVTNNPDSQDLVVEGDTNDRRSIINSIQGLITHVISNFFMLRGVKFDASTVDQASERILRSVFERMPTDIFSRSSVDICLMNVMESLDFLELTKGEKAVCREMGRIVGSWGIIVLSEPYGDSSVADIVAKMVCRRFDNYGSYDEVFAFREGLYNSWSVDYNSLDLSGTGDKTKLARFLDEISRSAASHRFGNLGIPSVCYDGLTPTQKILLDHRRKLITLVPSIVEFVQDYARLNLFGVIEEGSIEIYPVRAVDRLQEQVPVLVVKFNTPDGPKAEIIAIGCFDKKLLPESQLQMIKSIVFADDFCISYDFCNSE